ncbi:hypothetical protein [Oceanirhabdus sp. W0125-5]|uniref:hypothetical protein n=1 Tax=Oceanirhabdus sp. W0125-5 TaxID=2999116 RepID=UPI0022F304FA|nr:hypothetical protein [Oceanirhabdus sp. W0125-5]WBW98340.1 hypothetical protein OW730_06115 [Oceanirhabdus sp. W0125-5]
MIEYKVSKSKNKGRKSWSINFYHPMIIDEKTGNLERIRRGTGIEEEEKVDLIIADLQKLINDISYHNSAKREVALKEGINEKAVEIFYRDIYINNSYEYEKIREAYIPIENLKDHKVIDIEGFSGAGKTTLLQKLLGLEAEGEQVLATSTSKTTISNKEFIVSNDKKYSVVCIFKEKAKIEKYVKELIEGAIFEIIKNSTYDVIVKNFLETKDREFRLNYILGNISTRDKTIECSGYINKIARYNKGKGNEVENNKELEEILFNIISYAAKEWDEFLKGNNVNIDKLSKRRKLELEIKFTEKTMKMNRCLEFVEIIMNMINSVIHSVLGDNVTYKEVNKNGWIDYIFAENLDREACLNIMECMASNKKTLFGHIITPIVESIRAKGPFIPKFIDEKDDYKFIFLDGKGLDHILKEAFSIPPEIDGKLRKADRILWVNNASEGMKYDAEKFFNHIEISGYTTKLHMAFTHFDKINGENFYGIDSKVQHIVGNMNQVLELLSDSKGENIKRNLSDKLFFLENLNKKAVRDEECMTIQEIKDLINKLKVPKEVGSLYKEPLKYYKYLFPIDLIEVTKKYNERWDSLLGLKEDQSIKALPVQTVKALSRRYAELNSLSYDGLSPVGDMQKYLLECIYKMVTKPNYFEEDFFMSEENKSVVVSIIMENISKKVYEVCKERILTLNRQTELWYRAYHLRRGEGAAELRSEDIKEINRFAMPCYNISYENCEIKRFANQLLKCVLQEAFKEVNREYNTKIIFD